MSNTDSVKLSYEDFKKLAVLRDIDEAYRAMKAMEKAEAEARAARDHAAVAVRQMLEAVDAICQLKEVGMPRMIPTDLWDRSFFEVINGEWYELPEFRSMEAVRLVELPSLAVALGVEVFFPKDQSEVAP